MCVMDHVYRDLISRLRRAHQKQRRLQWIRALLLFMMCFGLIVLCLVLLESFVFFSQSIRLGFAISMGVFCFVALSLVVIYPIVKNPFNTNTLAKLIGNNFPDLRDRLLNALQLYHDVEKTNPFLKAEMLELDELCREIDFRSVVKTDALKKYVKVTGLIYAVIGLIFFSFQQPLMASLVRLRHVDKPFSMMPSIALKSLSKDIKVAKGQDARLVFKLQSSDEKPFINPTELIAKATIEVFDTQGFLSQDIDVFPDTLGKLSHVLRGVQKNGVYQAKIDFKNKESLVSQTFNIHVVEPGYVEWFQLSIKPPEYTRLGAQVLDKNVGETTVIKGSNVSIQGRLNRNVPQFGLSINDKPMKPLKLNAAGFSFAQRLYEPMTFQFVVKDTLQLLNKKSPVYRIDVLSDNMPEIEILEPQSRTMDLPGNLEIGIRGTVSDDFGISGIFLYYRLAKTEFGEVQETFQKIPIKDQSLQNPLSSASPFESGFSYAWRLNDMLLTAGDEIEFYVEAADNDNISGPKATQSAMFYVKFPGLDELFSRAETKEADIFEKLDEQISKSKKIQKELSQIDARLKQKSKTSWEDKQDIESLRKEQQQALERMAELAEKLNRLSETLEENQLASEETLKKYSEIQQLMEELNDPEFKRQQAKLQEALKKLNETEIRRALQNMDRLQKDFAQRLDRTLRLLKRMKIDRTFDELLERLNTMVDKQRDIQKQNNKSRKPSDLKQERLAKEQKHIQDMHRSYQASLKDLQEQLKNYDHPEKMPLSDMDSLNQRQKNDSLDSMMKSAESDMKTNQNRQAAQKQQKIISKLLSQRQLLSQMKTKASMLDLAFLKDYLMMMIRKAVDLSMHQEDLLMKMERQPSRLKHDSLQFKFSKNQAYLKEHLGYLQEKTKAIGNQSPKLEHGMMQVLKLAEIHMEKAINLIRSGYTFQIKREMVSSMSSLNEFADKSSAVLEQLLSQKPAQGQGGGSSQTNALRQLANQQGQLNKQTQGMQPGMKPDHAKRLAQLAAQQRLLQNQLQRLSARNKTSGGSKERLLGNLDELAQQMAEAAKSLESKSINRELIERQQKILSRLLDASMAMRKNDFEKRRQAKTATNPKHLPQLKALQAYEKSMVEKALDALNLNEYSDDYQKIIRNYYQKIEKALYKN